MIILKSGCRKAALISFLLFPFCLCAQESKWTTFKKLSGPEKKWVLIHPFIAARAHKITQMLPPHMEYAKAALKDTAIYGGRLDAFRHSMWMGLLSQKISWKKAVSLGRAHERGNYNDFKKRKTISHGKAAVEMDLWNNRMGACIGCANKNASAEDLRNLIITAIKEGRMAVIKEQEIKPSLP